jgi:hypothetical protein
VAACALANPDRGLSALSGRGRAEEKRTVTAGLGPRLDDDGMKCILEGSLGPPRVSPAPSRKGSPRKWGADIYVVLETC